jgi:hypothetical protein
MFPEGNGRCSLKDAQCFLKETANIPRKLSPMSLHPTYNLHPKSYNCHYKSINKTYQTTYPTELLRSLKEAQYSAKKVAMFPEGCPVFPEGTVRCSLKEIADVP